MFVNLQIKSLPKSMSNLSELATLDLFDNHLQHIPECLIELKKITRLDLDEVLYPIHDCVVMFTCSCSLFNKLRSGVHLIEKRHYFNRLAIEDVLGNAITPACGYIKISFTSQYKLGFEVSSLYRLCMYKLNMMKNNIYMVIIKSR